MVRFRKKLWPFLVVLFCFSSAEDESSNVMKIKSRPRSFLTYNNKQELKNSTDDEIDNNESYIPYDLQIVIDAVLKLNYSECGKDALVVMDAIKRREKWALQMFDASSKFPVGLLKGQFYQFGNFDECVGLKQPTSKDNQTPVQGQYCLADVELFKKKESEGRVVRSFETVKARPRHAFKSIMHWGVCVPSSCTPEEVAIVVKEIFTMATDHKMISVQLNKDRCHTNHPQPITALEIVYGSIVGAFLVFTLLATVFHFYIIKEKKSRNVEAARSSHLNLLKESILCFSIINTVRKFLNTKRCNLNMECLGGIKFLSMSFILAGHSLLFFVGGPVLNTDFYEQEVQMFPNAIFTNSPLLVDTFLLLSGFLMSFLFLIELEKRRGKVNFLFLYIGRYIRLTPAYLVVIGLYTTFLFRLGDGPLWDSKIGQEKERCLESWWTNILYVNNYVNTDNMCMFQSWYLAADYHLFIIAPFIIYPLWRWQKIGKGVLGITTFASILIPFVITFKDKLDPTLMIFPPEVYDVTQNFYFKTTYVKTHMRAGSYFFGIIFGYLLYKIQNKGIKISKFVIWFGWLFSVICGTVSMYSIVIFYHPYHEYSSFEAAIYASLHRVAWCMSIGCIIIICITNNGGLVNRFLSWKPFIPLSRLTYCAYLSNGFIELYSVSSLRQPIYASKFELGSRLVAHFILTFIAAFLLCILFESPIHGLEKVALSTEKNKTNSDQANNNDDTP